MPEEEKGYDIWGAVLFDLFALGALIGLIGESTLKNEPFERIACDAYGAAEAMMKERKARLLDMAVQERSKDGEQ